MLAFPSEFRWPKHRVFGFRLQVWGSWSAYDELDSAPFQGSEFKEIVLRQGTPKERKQSGQVHLSNYGLPQFFST
jgi:hypothetical protein